LKATIRAISPTHYARRHGRYRPRHHHLPGVVDYRCVVARHAFRLPGYLQHRGRFPRTYVTVVTFTADVSTAFTPLFLIVVDSPEPTPFSYRPDYRSQLDRYGRYGAYATIHLGHYRFTCSTNTCPMSLIDAPFVSPFTTTKIHHGLHFAAILVGFLHSYNSHISLLRYIHNTVAILFWVPFPCYLHLGVPFHSFY